MPLIHSQALALSTEPTSTFCRRSFPSSPSGGGPAALGHQTEPLLPPHSMGHPPSHRTCRRGSSCRRGQRGERLKGVWGPHTQKPCVCIRVGEKNSKFSAASAVSPPPSPPAKGCLSQLSPVSHPRLPPRLTEPLRGREGAGRPARPAPAPHSPSCADTHPCQGLGLQGPGTLRSRLAPGIPECGRAL